MLEILFIVRVIEFILSKEKKYVFTFKLKEKKKTNVYKIRKSNFWRPLFYLSKTEWILEGRESIRKSCAGHN